MSQQLNRLHELDSLRALAAFGVIGWHYTNHLQASPVAYLMQPFYRHGLLLVDCFFALSGFVLARTYWNERRSAALLTNFRDRGARIYPLHFVTLCSVALMQWFLASHLSSQPFVYAYNDKYDFALNAILLNRTGLERGFSFNAPSWSISTEFIVNVLFFSVIALPRKIAQVGLLVLFLVSLGVVVKNGLISNAKVLGAIDNDIFRTITSFLAGFATSIVHERYHSQTKIRPILADGAVVVALATVVYYCTKGGLSDYRDLAVALIIFPLIILGVIHGGAVKAILIRRPLSILEPSLTLSTYFIFHYSSRFVLYPAVCK